MCVRKPGWAVVGGGLIYPSPMLRIPSASDIVTFLGSWRGGAKEIRGQGTRLAGCLGEFVALCKVAEWNTKDLGAAVKPRLEVPPTPRNCCAIRGTSAGG